MLGDTFRFFSISDMKLRQKYFEYLDKWSNVAQEWDQQKDDKKLLKSRQWSDKMTSDMLPDIRHSPYNSCAESESNKGEGERKHIQSSL